MRRLSILLARGVTGPALAALGILAAVGLVMEGTMVALRAPVLPAASTLVAATLALAPSLLAFMLPLALFVGCLGCFRRWRLAGVWTGLEATGLAARKLVAPIAVAGLGVMLVALLLDHTLAPAGCHASARMLAESTASLRLVPGRFVPAGKAVLLAMPEGGVFASDGSGSAVVSQTATIVPEGGGLRLGMEQGRALPAGKTPVFAAFERGDLPLVGPGGSRRLDLEERSDSSLVQVARKREAAGKDASYERALLHKRSTGPLAGLLLPLLAIPLGLRWGGKSTHAVATVAAWWALVRIGDQGCAVLGPLIAAFLPVFGLAAATLLLWSTWRER
jgi:lipopolysaccharide export LptBFGC system permease protein LptF